MALTRASSREIAELTGKRHPDVKRDIRNMLDGLQVDASIFAHTYLDAANRSQEELLLDKEHTLCLVSGYNVKMRIAIIRRWQHLEEQKQATTPRLSLPP